MPAQALVNVFGPSQDRVFILFLNKKSEVVKFFRMPNFEIKKFRTWRIVLRIQEPFYDSYSRNLKIKDQKKQIIFRCNDCKGCWNSWFLCFWLDEMLPKNSARDNTTSKQVLIDARLVDEKVRHSSNLIGISWIYT